MKGYIIAEVDVHDPEQYEGYKALVPGSLEPYGGRFVVRGGDPEALEGDWQPQRIVVLEFDSPEQARAWYDSEEYREAKAIRQAASRGTLLLVEGAG